MHRIRRHHSFLRTALLVLVALGVLIQPIMGSLDELHDLEHAVATQSDHDHSHHDEHDDPPGDDDAPGDPIGIHTLLHQGGFAASMALLEPSFLFLSPIPVGDPPVRTRTPRPLASHLTLPFRPPIA